MEKNEQDALDFMQAMRVEFTDIEFRVTTKIAVVAYKNYKEEKPGTWIIPQVYVVKKN